ncbi:hypothetical protein [Lentimicrobium sp.]|jgi:hypothetical protein|uniref:hypothetical protein n=1 Tax=Lentimicrobium sp. TaxID=2034841 RepID=UPI0025DBAEDC|nr:hypothetical protein [Lentimicrobium sp.]MCO5258507.1 hypothetical protein [Lentimicrobium sp.]MCO5264161.1 hypothetical protein [Lentimicrobium sp.]HOP14323.1 hypothetical protein [Lentimicrobium sp.]HPF65961.1 hypothetical protein [Lentimicrobium sp.]HPJ63815.1 hypothetical protein [Lentimicrobium sp.]
MKKVIIALSVFAFLFAFSGITNVVAAHEVSVYTESFTGDKDPKVDGTKKANKSGCATEASKSSCGDKAVKTASKGDCSKPCDKSAKAQSSDCGSKKATTAQAVPASESK